MSVRIQVILNESEAARFKMQAQKESKSLSAWLRDAGLRLMELNNQRSPLTTQDALKEFFKSCENNEKGVEPDWEEHKRIILEGYQPGHKP